MSLGTFSRAHESLADATDEDLLLTHVNGGTEDAFAVLRGRYERELYSYLRRFLNDAAAAEDAFQNAFIQVHLKASQFRFDEGRKFRPWLYTIATNAAIDLQRRNKKHTRVSLDRRKKELDGDGISELSNILEGRELGGEAEMVIDERAKAVRRVLSGLSKELREAIRLRFYEEKSYGEMVEQIGVPDGTVKSRIYNGKKAMRKKLLEDPDFRDAIGMDDDGPAQAA